MTEPVSLADIKQHLVLDPDDTSEDSYLSGLIMAARAACEAATRRSVVGESRRAGLDAFPAGVTPLVFPLHPVPTFAADITLPGGSISAIAVSYFDGDGAEQLLDPAGYHADLASIPAVLRPVTSWPATQDRPGAVAITYTVSPLTGGQLAMVTQAIRLIVGHWYANREAVNTDARNLAELPLAVSWLLKPLTLWASS